MRLGILLVLGLLPIGAQNRAATTVEQPVSATAIRLDKLHGVDPSQMYHRVYARVPMVGAGTKEDPRRPMFAPFPAPSAVDRTGVIAFQVQVSDDGNWGLVEFVGASPKELQFITQSANANVKVFERGKTTQAEIEAEFKKYKKNFTMSMFVTRAQ